MKIQLLRNACLLISVNGKNILIDPMLAPKDSYPAIPYTANTLRNPLIDLPVSDSDLKNLISQTDAVLLTHLHNDHWDETARELLAKDVTLYCQPADLTTIAEQGFTNITAIDDELTWEGIQFIRTGGQHGTGETGKRLGPVSGYIIRFGQEHVYIAGDTIWCDEVKQSIDRFQPENIILNGGGARFVTGDPIVMDTQDIITVCRHIPSSKIYIVHIEAINHYTESRIVTREIIAENCFDQRCFVPEDGEIFINE